MFTLIEEYEGAAKFLIILIAATIIGLFSANKAASIYGGLFEQKESITFYAASQVIDLAELEGGVPEETLNELREVVFEDSDEVLEKIVSLEGLLSSEVMQIAMKLKDELSSFPSFWSALVKSMAIDDVEKERVALEAQLESMSKNNLRLGQIYLAKVQGKSDSQGLIASATSDTPSFDGGDIVSLDDPEIQDWLASKIDNQPIERHRKA